MDRMAPANAPSVPASGHQLAGPFEGLVRDALLRVHDVPYLRTHALAALARPAPAPRASPGPPRGTADAGAGAALQRDLLGAIEALRPAAAPGAAPGGGAGGAARRHRLLGLRYGEALPVAEVQARLALSRSEYFREHRAALATLAELLRERWDVGAAAGPAGGTEAGPAPAPPGNLPAALSGFVGREDVLGAAAGLLSGTRLLTLIGPGGVGKTRLALRLAERVRAEAPADVPDGVWFVPLAPLTDPADVAPAIARALGVREAGDRPLPAVLGEALRGRRLLLVLDNLEHVLAAAPLAAELLAAAPGLRVVATSRAALRVEGEQALPVPPLALPPPASLEGRPDPEGLSRYESVALFVQRAGGVAPGFRLTGEDAPAVARICARLDGLPLAIELAAARVRVLPPRQLLARLDDRFRLLTGGSRAALPRQQTLRATVEWSYALLDDAERRLFGRLAVFAGGWTLEAAEAVGADAGGAGIAPHDVLDLLTRLAEQSLVETEAQPDGTARYRLLETLREYARERLAAGGEAAALRERHAAHYLREAEAGPTGQGPPDLALVRTVAEAWEREHDNVRAALAWWLERGEAERGLRLVTALDAFWQSSGCQGEALRWLDALLAAGPVAAPVRAAALALAGYHTHHRGDYARARALHEASVTLWREVGDPGQLSGALTSLGLVYCLQGDLARAAALIREGLTLARTAGRGAGVSRCLRDLSHVARAGGDYPRARALLEESTAAARAAGEPWHAWRSGTWLARVAYLQGRHGEAAARLREALADLQDLAGPSVAVADALEWLAAAVAPSGQAGRAARLYGAAARRRRDAGATRYAPDRPAYEQDVAKTRAQLSPQAFATAWAAGEAMTLEQAVTDALEENADTA
jgi:non-specific serine/threonine protein kinase